LRFIYDNTLQRQLYTVFASVQRAFSAGGDVKTQRRYWHSLILTPEKWNCLVQNVKYSGEYGLGCVGQNAGVNRHPDSLLIVVQNALLIGVTMQSFL
jgi:hypothetical protein